VRDNKASGNDPVAVKIRDGMGPRTLIESKSNTAMPLEMTPVRVVPSGSVNVGVPLVLIVYVPIAVGNAPSDAKSSGFSGPALAQPVEPSTSKASKTTDRGTLHAMRTSREAIHHWLHCGTLRCPISSKLVSSRGGSPKDRRPYVRATSTSLLMIRNVCLSQLNHSGCREARGA